jgi:lipopolysaccharide transport system permease protein
MLASSKSSATLSCTVIGPSRSRWKLPVLDLWRHRELLYFLIWRDIKVRYKQTVLGLAWAIIQPLMIALTLTLFLGHLAKMPSDGLPYVVFAYSATAMWQLFAQSLTGASNSMLDNERLVTKVHFPRLIIPLSAVVASLLDFAIAFLVLVLFLAYYRILPSTTWLALPFLVVLTAVLASGVGFWLAALNVKYRDVRYTLGFLVQFWFLASPIAYSSSVVPERWRVLYALNPMVGILDGFRWGLRGTGPAPLHLLAVSAGVTVLLFMIGLYYFQNTEDTFADII